MINTICRALKISSPVKVGTCEGRLASNTACQTPKITTSLLRYI